jgi:hypothetical protein
MRGYPRTRRQLRRTAKRAEVLNSLNKEKPQVTKPTKPEKEKLFNDP